MLKITKDIVTLASVTGESIREDINGVAIYKDGRMVVTDSFMCIEHKTDIYTDAEIVGEKSPEIGDEPLFLKSDPLIKSQKFSNDKYDVFRNQAIIVEHGDNIKAMHYCKGSLIETHHIKNEGFVNYEKIMPQHAENTIRLDVNLLEKLVKTVKKLGYRELEMSYTSDYKPVLFTSDLNSYSGDNKLRAVIMPITK